MQIEAKIARVILLALTDLNLSAAPSYAPIFQRRPLRGLFLTATPNRTDDLPIGIDEVAYTTRPFSNRRSQERTSSGIAISSLG